MPPIHTPWKRLIRFVALEDGQVHIGEPVDPQLDVGRAYHDNAHINAYEILGDALGPGTASLTKNALTVKTLLSPLSREQVGLVRCLGLNYADHAAEANLAKPAFPILFYKPASTLIGPEAPITVPAVAQPVNEHLPDYEVELAVVIGKVAKDVSEDEALDYVLGYTGANDISFRQLQMAVSQWGFSKSLDNTNPLGPCLVSSSVFGDPQDVNLRCEVNGQTLQDGNTSEQIFNVRQTIAFLSQGTTLTPGTVILTGTPKGVGFVKKPPVFLCNGDEVRVWLGKGIGTMVNKVQEDRRNGRAKL